MYRPSQTPHLNLSSVGRGRSIDSDETTAGTGTATPPPKSLGKTGCTSALARRRVNRVQTWTMNFVISPDNRVECGDEGSSGISWFGASASHLCCTSDVSAQIQTRVKLNRVFFPRSVHASPFPCLLVHRAVDRDSGNLVNPFMRVTN